MYYLFWVLYKSLVDIKLFFSKLHLKIIIKHNCIFDNYVTEAALQVLFVPGVFQLLFLNYFQYLGQTIVLQIKNMNHASLLQ